MRRPSCAEVLRRWSLVSVLLVVVAALVWGLATRDRDGSEETVATTTSALAAVTSTTVPPSTAPPTTVSTGRFLPDVSVPGAVVGQGSLRTYRVEVEDGAGISVEEFTAEVERILSDPRGWTAADGVSLQRVTGPEAEITVTLAAPATVDLLCYPLQTDGDVSCAQEARAVINVRRWTEGSEPSRLALGSYREYLISHEVGHVLGHHHVGCPGAGQPAPVMLQQTLGIGECLPNPWPAPDARAG